MTNTMMPSAPSTPRRRILSAEESSSSSNHHHHNDSTLLLSLDKELRERRETSRRESASFYSVVISHEESSSSTSTLNAKHSLDDMDIAFPAPKRRCPGPKLFHSLSEDSNEQDKTADDSHLQMPQLLPRTQSCLAPAPRGSFDVVVSDDESLSSSSSSSSAASLSPSFPVPSSPRKRSKSRAISFADNDIESLPFLLPDLNSPRAGLTSNLMPMFDHAANHD